jgi:hypothetical protein
MSEFLPSFMPSHSFLRFVCLIITIRPRIFSSNFIPSNLPTDGPGKTPTSPATLPPTTVSTGPRKNNKGPPPPLVPHPNQAAEDVHPAHASALQTV